MTASDHHLPGGAKTALALFCLGGLAGFFVTRIVAELWPDESEPWLAPLQEVRDFVRESYVRDVSDEELADLALHGMVEGLDPYSRYYDRAEAQELERETAGRYLGVGIVFRRPLEQGVVLFTLPASPGRRAGLAVGDKILAIDGQRPEELGEEGMRRFFSDSRPHPLQLRVLARSGTERELQLEPDSVVDPTVRHTAMLDTELGLGYIAILSFSRQTPTELDEHFETLLRRGMKALVLDLRRNYGGVLDSAVSLARRFIPESEEAASPALDLIVSTEGRGAPILYRTDGRLARYEGFPLVVLVDGDSASASEVLAGALQEHRVAVIVGSPTYGKGMVQTIRGFERRGTMAKVTSAYYYSPTHRNFERTLDAKRDYGIRPDLLVPVSVEERAAIHRYLGRYSPPLDLLAEVEAWEREEGVGLLEERPADAQLEAALELLRGRLPGPQPVVAGG